MKKKWMVFIFLLWVGVAPSWSSTQLLQHDSDMEILEAGLGGLKESYRVVTDRNDRLLSDIVAYAKNIKLLHQELERLNEAKACLLEGRPQAQGSPSEESEESLRVEIDRLSRELDSVSQEKVEEAFQSKKRALISSIEKNKGDIKNKEADLNKMTRQYGEPLKKIESLKTEQARLKSKLEASRDKLKKSIEESEMSGQFLSRADVKGEEHLSQLNNDLVRLRIYKDKLTRDILKKVQDTASTDSSYERDLWERKINDLKKESAALKDEFGAIHGLYNVE